MTETPDKARADLRARQINARLKAEGLGVQPGKDRGALSAAAKAEKAERARMLELRRRPGYAAAEARQPFEAERRLIKGADRPVRTTTGTSASPPPRPTFEEMREQVSEFPATPDEVIRRKQGARARRRAAKKSTRK